MAISALIFDCDGTLTDSMPLHFLAWRETMSRHGIEFAEDRFYSLGGMPTDKIIAMLAREAGIALDAAEVSREKEQAFLDHAGRLPMAVASGGFRGVIELQVRRIGLEGFFHTLVTAEDTERHKPEPDVFLEAARRLGAPPHECRVYEDSDLGIEAARRAGMEWVDVREFHVPKRWTK
jgi:HAD superfamily hydrolase (TIGR01509 family)